MNLAGKPSQMTVFDALYSIAAGDGRGEALFGNSFDLARNAYERTLYCIPVFAKFHVRADELLGAKIYLQAGAVSLSRFRMPSAVD